MNQALLQAKETIAAYHPQEASQQEMRKLFLDCIAYFPDMLTRENKLFHLTSSALVLNESMEKVLFCHHNIYQTWCWPGGHVDGSGDLLAVAQREAEEECGISGLALGYDGIASLDLLSVVMHQKKGETVLPHLHLSVGYALIARDSLPIRALESENSAVSWIPWEQMEAYSQEPHLIKIYHRIYGRAISQQNMRGNHHASNTVVL